MSTIDYIIAQNGTAVTLRNNLNASNQFIQNLATPVNPSDAVPKSYVDNAVPSIVSLSNISTAAPTNITSITFLSGKTITTAGLVSLNMALQIVATQPNTLSSFTFTLPLKTNGIVNVYDVYGQVSGYFDTTNQYTVWNGNVSGVVATTNAKVSFKSHDSYYTDNTHYIFIKMDYTV